MCCSFFEIHTTIIFLIEEILFLENWDYISKFKLVRKFVLFKRRVDHFSEHWKVGVNRPLSKFTGIFPSLGAFLLLRFNISFLSSFDDMR